jgi:L-threonylcarbamoyladenylate synthase
VADRGTGGNGGGASGGSSGSGGSGGSAGTPGTAGSGSHVRPADDGRVLDARQPEAISAAIDALTDGDLVGIPTDTVYGVAALANEEGIRRLIDAKGRDPSKGIALLIDDIEQVAHMARIPEPARRLAARFWPGPLTIVLPLREAPGVSHLLTGGRPTIGVRVPDHEVPRALARALGPLAVSSANRSGEPDARDADSVIAALGDAVALVLDAGPSPGGVPSTVVGVADDGSVTVLRAGAVPAEAIMAAVAPD